MVDAQSEGQCDGAAGSSLSAHAIIAGFGIPGRAVADQLSRQRVAKTSIHGLHVTVGDVSDEATLRRAGIERATLFAITVPVDAAVLEAVRMARRLSPKLHIMARCRYISTALEATRRGADEVIAEEQVVAKEFNRLIAARAEAGESRE
jgi:voltage-gated potassium channel Kch